MGYSLKKGNVLIGSKLTEVGRYKIAKGELNFATYSLGDSEIDYNLIDNNSRVIRPVNDNSNISSFIVKDSGETETTITDMPVKILTVNNFIEDKGFFLPGDIDDMTTYQLDPEKQKPVIEPNDFTLYQVPPSNGVYLFGKNGNDKRGALGTMVGNYPGTGPENDLDGINDFLCKECYSENWDQGSLQFQNSCDTTLEDTECGVWNMSILTDCDWMGLDGVLYKNWKDYLSAKDLGTKHLLQYKECFKAIFDPEELNCKECEFQVSYQNICSIAVIHYSNRNLSGAYGEFFFIDEDNRVEIKMPHLLWNAKKVIDDNGDEGSGNARAQDIGMAFISDTEVNFLPNTDIPYYDLIEYPAYSLTPGEPRVVGKVFHTLQMVVFDDPELVAAVSYQSNRNYTLPGLKLSTITPQNPNQQGVLQPNEAMYVTYEFRGVTPMERILPCQKIAKLVNGSAFSKDVSFVLEDINLLPFMSTPYFYATDFVVLAQVVSDPNEEPDPLGWIEIDYTTPDLYTQIPGQPTNVPGGNINPKQLETQSYTTFDFFIDFDRYMSGTFYTLPYDELGVPLKGETSMSFGDEQFFFGNICAYAGARIFKSFLRVVIDSGTYVDTTNCTYRDSDVCDSCENEGKGNLRVSEIAIYDDEGNVVLISKLTTPVEIVEGANLIIEIGLDF